MIKVTYTGNKEGLLVSLPGMINPPYNFGENRVQNMADQDAALLMRQCEGRGFTFAQGEPVNEAPATPEPPMKAENKEYLSMMAILEGGEYPENTGEEQGPEAGEIPDVSVLNRMKKDDLVAYATEHNIEVDESMTKAMVIDRILTSSDQGADGVPPENGQSEA